tara:strand:+ start:886 stop:1617 length:732 start_codon:yes stop_codon:yes gene_type:complete
MLVVDYCLMPPKVISHRGRTSKKNQDNTIHSVQDAINLGIDMVEVDVRRTKDLEIICFHDEYIDGELISNLAYSEILSIDPKVPTLDQILWAAKHKIEIDVELKEEGYENEVISLVLDYLDYEAFIMKSFSRSAVRRIKQFDSKIKTGFLLGESYSLKVYLEILKEAFTGRIFKSEKVDFISPHYKVYEMGLMFKISQKNLPIQLWTVNDSNLLEIAMKRDLHSVVTDIPEEALSIREAIYGS